MDVSEQFHFFQKKDLVELRYEEKSLMPDNYGQLLSKEELDNLVAYLKTLQNRDLKDVTRIRLAGGLEYERIRDSRREPHNWLTYWGDYQGWHYSRLDQINTKNVQKLQATLGFPVHQGRDPGSHSFGHRRGHVHHRSVGLRLYAGRCFRAVDLGVSTSSQRGPVPDSDDREPQPRAAGAEAFLGHSSMRVWWRWTPRRAGCCGRRKWRTGKMGIPRRWPRWPSRTRSSRASRGESLAFEASSTPTIPQQASDCGGFTPYPVRASLDMTAGKVKVGKPVEAPTWMTGTYDPDLDIVYWGIGNPSPDFDGDVRKGDNLFTCSVVALDASTGRLKWHFQFTPHDTHDWDANETPVLVDRSFRGRSRKLLLQANRNAFFYVLDRATGEFLLGKPFARQTWARGLDRSGRPILTPNSEASEEGVLVYPAQGGHQLAGALLRSP